MSRIPATGASSTRYVRYRYIAAPGDMLNLVADFGDEQPRVD
jgi:hypothetical protein